MFEEYAERLLAALESGADWLQGELPEFIGEVLTYYAWFYGIWLFAFLLILVFSAWLLRKAVTYDPTGSFDDGAFGFWVGGFIGAVLSVFGAAHSLLELVKVTVAPRLFLIEWLRGLNA